ncbi:DUF427 domain-containing protein [Halomonas sp. TD01]|uniref:DUF427 domain-containing protein n=1 Tax=Halomonas sp. TD01 TaxID=999141 RepID=UPI000214EC08|nr:DUF427 domain-containing protein [Halomonas sp. TD01]EGP21348.1 hypothetical protein GME_01819 [Halomonas sp. TD01]CAH1043794.1 hypothetical protein HPTD01_2272 [Halomonas sp. TD01]
MQNAPRIELHPISQRVQAQVDGTLIADSTNTLELREYGYPPRHYFPREDVRMDLLTISETTTYCPLKGDVTYCTPMWRGAMTSSRYAQKIWI